MLVLIGMLKSFLIHFLLLMYIISFCSTSDSSNTAAITNFESNFNFCIGLIHLSRNFQDGLPIVFSEAMDSLEKTDQKVITQFFETQTIERMDALGAIVGRVIFGMFQSNHGNFCLAVRLGRWLVSMNIQPDSQQSSSYISSIDWGSYRLPRILDLMEVLSDVAYHIAPHIIRLKEKELSQMIRETVYSDQKRQHPEKWAKSLADIFRFSSYKDLFNFYQTLCSVPEKMVNLSDYSCQFFRKFPYFSVARVLVNLIPQFEETFSETDTHRKILDLAKYGCKMDYLQHPQEGEKSFLFALFDRAKWTSFDSIKVQYLALEHLSTSYFKNLNIYSNSLLTWMDSLVPQRFSIDLLDQSLPLLTNLLQTFPFDNELSTLIIERVRFGLEDALHEQIVLKTSALVVSKFFKACMYPKITDLQVNVAVAILGRFYRLLSKAEQHELIVQVGQSLNVDHLQHLASIVSQFIILPRDEVQRADDINEKEEELAWLAATRGNLVMQFLIMILLNKLGFLRPDRPVDAYQELVIQQWIILVEKHGKPLGEEIIDQVAQLPWSITRTPQITKLFRAINLVSEKFLSFIINILRSPFDRILSNYDLFFYFMLVLDMLDQINVQDNLWVFSDICSFYLLHEDKWSLFLKGPSYLQGKLLSAAETYLSGSDATSLYHREKVLSIASRMSINKFI